MNAPWPNAKTHQLFQVPERGCPKGPTTGRPSGPNAPAHPASRQPALVAMQVTGGELRLAARLMPVELPAGTDLAMRAVLILFPGRQHSLDLLTAARGGQAVPAVAAVRGSFEVRGKLTVGRAPSETATTTRSRRACGY